MATTSSAQAGASRRSVADLRHLITVGAVAGALASLVMAGYAMIASATYQHHGLFTPLFHIASLFVAPTQLMASMTHAMTGDTFYFTFGTALLGALAHIVTGALYGAAFGALVALTRISRAMWPVAGAAWGAAVFVISSWVALPLAAAVFNSGDQITHMARLVGYGTFFIEHVLFGLALGALVALGKPARR